MRYLLVAFHFILFTVWSSSGYEEEDENPALYHHVNVITGDLNLVLEDTVVQGAKTLPIIRTYTSAGALERDKKKDDKSADLVLKRLHSGFLIQGGWSYFPHTKLLARLGNAKATYIAYVVEKTGAVTTYSYSDKKGSSTILKPKQESGKSFGKISGKSNKSKSYLRIDKNNDKATLFLPDGTIRYYRCEKGDLSADGLRLFNLEKEELPSKHAILYSYNGKGIIKEIKYSNPAGNKTFSSINFFTERPKTPYRFQAHTSDGKTIDYKFKTEYDRDYLEFVNNEWGSHQFFEYIKGRRGIGLRTNAISFDGKTQCKIIYYPPPNEKKEKRWEDHPEEKEFPIDKVSKLEAPLGPNGENTTLALFYYEPNLTQVRDSQNLLIKYFHENGHPTLIEYFDKRDNYASAMKFLWSGEQMTGKIKLDQNKTPIFSKTFSYDEAGNVLQETFWGNITGKAPGPYGLESNGHLRNAESFTKHYTYDKSLNLLLQEREEEGLTYDYQYKPGTDLLTAKLTSSKGRVLLREFYFYNEDHLLCAEILDDGSSSNPNDLTSVTERKIKRYDLDPQNGLPLRISEWSHDLESGGDVLIKKVELGYSPQKRVISEAVYDSQGVYRYTLYTDYDPQGNITRRTTPIGQENIYKFDRFSNLIEAKEVGLLRKKMTYDTANRLIQEEEMDSHGESKTKKFSYDSKGRLLQEVDSLGYVTKQTYDAFGQCIQSELSSAKDKNGIPYTPIICFSYDSNGNLASTANPSGDVTKTYYTSFRKPYKIIQADGGETTHIYNKKESIQKTSHPDGSEEHFEYDPFHRMTSRATFSKEGDLLEEESWVYSTFHLLEHTDVRGLTTYYFYDSMGRLVKEAAENRTKEYVYDSLGFLEKTYEGGACQASIHDEAGRILEQWVEDSNGSIENWMRFEYDAENKKISAERKTFQGLSKDLFSYDAKGRLSLHTDPLQHQTQFIYSENTQNDLGQYVLVKKTIDPIGLIKVETYDVQGRLCAIERQDTQGNTVSKEEVYFDRAGNTAKKVSYIYQNNELKDTYSVSWEYDSCGRVVQETESGKKPTYYTYNLKGELIRKVLSSEIAFNYEYDGIGRLLEQISSDGSIHYRYSYSSGPEPTYIEDLSHRTSICRSYNRFGELVGETTTENFSYSWEYDSRGRCISFTLPDGSKILNTYSDLHLYSVFRQTSQGLSYQHTYTQFDPNGHVQEERMIADLGVITTEHDLLERPTIQSTPWHSCSFTYGDSGLVTQATNTLFDSRAYDYDALNQIKKEGSTEYCFDSLGNPSEATIGEYNQLLSNREFEFSYDAEGRPTLRKGAHGLTTYTYDALGRLTCIEEENGEAIRFSYDAFSRLVSKETQEGKKRYLYNQQIEIGSVDDANTISELKILGLGIKGDVGATLAIEIDDEVFAPLHDLRGNIVGLLSKASELIESYDINAFGKENSSLNPSRNPWRFCSKRHEDGLIFFGLRFYDPAIGRWLTPDPAGFTEGLNLYVYVLNSPINRLDLFGLASEPFFPGQNVNLEVPLHIIYRAPTSFRSVQSLKGSIDGVEVDWLVVGGNWSKLTFSSEELQAGKVNLFNHFHELFPSEGKTIGCVTLMNGIQTSLGETAKMVNSVHTDLPENTLVIGLYSPSSNIISDARKAIQEISNTKETKMISLTRQFLAAMSTTLFNVNPSALWLHIAHSRGGGIASRAAEGMPQEQLEIMKQNFMYLGIAPSVPMANDYAYKANNTYSTFDKTTGRYGQKLINHPNYNIEFVKSEISMVRQVLTPPLAAPFFSDHSFLGETYSENRRKKINILDSDIGFFHETTR